ncbi:hypothetical protein SAMN06264849_11024 [Melghirimyces algeriensis]|uniref:Uncharacterized protein n=1 Tax=Melghirimyces algeriensis TaxID=910412 RepID=A0A521EQ48_9BACL|nr:hypothetical protein SAMN06264849_11024 [Melghirimyces algeriensis]
MRLMTKGIRGGEAESFHFYLLEERDAETDITPSPPCLEPQKNSVFFVATNVEGL